MRITTPLIVLGLLLIPACSQSPERTSERTGDTDSLPPLTEDQVRAIAVSYQDTMLDMTEARWSPLLCTIPNSFLRSHSASEDHGRKLYELYSNAPGVYYDIAADDLADAPVGMTLVKRSFVPRPKRDTDWEPGLADESGGLWFPGEESGLFIMTRLDPTTPGTDDGWVYATTDPSGHDVYEIGLIESCIGCHASAPRGRLYGVVTASEDVRGLTPDWVSITEATGQTRRSGPGPD